MYKTRKILQGKRVCGYLQKLSMQNLGVWHPLAAQANNLQSFLCENRIFHQFAIEGFGYMVFIFEVLV